MAKQHRMALMTVALLINTAETVVYGTHKALLLALIVIVIGSLITCGTRTLTIIRQLKENGHVDLKRTDF